MKRFHHWHEAALAVLVLLVMAVAWRIDPKFVEWDTQKTLFGLIWEPALIALAMTLVVITGGIDLSVGATMSLSAVAFGLCYENKQPIIVCAFLAVVVGAACGLVNGLVVTKMRVHPLIVTLGTLAAYYGLAEGLSHARPISGFETGLTNLVGSSVPLLTVMLASVGTAVFLSNTVAGRALFAIGHNEEATRYSGVPIDRIKTSVYVLCGLFSGIAALFYAARRNTAQADIGQGMELNVITAVVLGGAAITGGRGGVIGTLLGLLLLHEVKQFVSWHWECDELNLIVVGSVLICAVLLNSLLSRAAKNAK